MKKEHVSHKIDMCSGPMAGNILRFVIPLMLANILQLMFHAADIIVVSNFAGEQAMAAVGSTGSLINLITGLFMGVATATNILAARYIGEKKHSNLHNLTHTTILFASIGGIVLATIGLLFSHKALKLMGSPDGIIELSTLYLKIYFLGSPANLLYNMGSALLRAKGDTKRPLYIIILAGITNVILNLIFVIGFKMSVDGVAIATVVSQYVSAILVMACLVTDHGYMRLEFRRLKIHKEEFLKTLRMGIPAGIQGMVFSLANITVQSSVNSLGPETMAAFAASGSIQGFLYVICNAFYHSNMTFTSQNMGANQWDRMKLSLKLNIVFDVSIGIAIGILSMIFVRPLLGIYITDPVTMSVGITIMKYYTLPIFLCGLMETIMGSLRGMGYTVTTMIVSIIGGCVLRIIWISTIFRAYPNADVLFAIYPISWILTSLTHFGCFKILYKKKRKEAELKELA